MKNGISQKATDRAIIARSILSGCGISPGEDFFNLRRKQVEDLLVWADIERYRKPANANGSRGRYYYSKLMREANRVPTPTLGHRKDGKS